MPSNEAIGQMMDARPTGLGLQVSSLLISQTAHAPRRYWLVPKEHDHVVAFQPIQDQCRSYMKDRVLSLQCIVSNK
jgi:hypothetical protein